MRRANVAGHSKAKKLTQRQFETIRRNMFATNLIANFTHTSLSVEQLVAASLQFNGAKLEVLRLFDSHVSDVSMTGFEIGIAQFENCTMSRVEIVSWAARTLDMSGNTSGNHACARWNESAVGTKPTWTAWSTMSGLGVTTEVGFQDRRHTP
jgi:hypothetical protein